MTVRKCTIFEAKLAPDQGNILLYNVDIIYLLPVPANNQRPNPSFKSTRLWLDVAIAGRTEPVLAGKGGYTAEEINAIVAGTVIEYFEVGNSAFDGGTVQAPKAQATRKAEIRAYAIGGDYPNIGDFPRWQVLTAALAAKDPGVKAVGDFFVQGVGWTSGW
jgi:hypothetical protein